MGLNWTFSPAHDCETTDYRGFTIRAERDTDAQNPFEAWDCEPPTLVYSGRSNRSDYAEGACEGVLDSSILSDGKFSRHWRAIAKALDVEPDSFHAEALEDQRDYGGRLVDIKREKAQEALEELKPSHYSGNADDYLEALAELWRIAGREAVAWSSSGYSQGDYATGLSVATLEWAKLVGAPRKTHKRQLEHAGELWGAWAWGDVYGYVIKGPDDCELGEMGDSVWGYYGSDHDESGLEESAIAFADHYLDRMKRKRADRLKSLVRNRAPLDVRAFHLAAVVGPLAPLFGQESV